MLTTTTMMMTPSGDDDVLHMIKPEHKYNTV